MTLDQIAEEALTLRDEGRAMLAGRLVESLDPTDDANLQAVWGAEAMRRLTTSARGALKPSRWKKP